MALALPIASQLHASAGITALGVMLTGGPNLMFTLALVLTLSLVSHSCDRTHDPSAVPSQGS